MVQKSLHLQKSSWQYTAVSTKEEIEIIQLLFIKGADFRRQCISHRGDMLNILMVNPHAFIIQRILDVMVENGIDMIDDKSKNGSHSSSVSEKIWKR